MRKPSLLFTAVMLIISIAYFSCKKTDSPGPGNGNNSFPTPAETPVTGSVAGIILDENNAPVNGAVVTIGTNSYVTNSSGTFNTAKMTLDRYVSTVVVSKQGYFKGYRSFCANATKNYVSIKLIQKTLTGSFTSSSSVSVNLSNGSQISFTDNSIKYKNSGASYTGTVNVYASYVDPTSADISAKVPGSFMGQDASNTYVLASKGMIAVDLESPSGEPLQLVTGKPASLKLAIPSTLLANAPATIATWSLDDRGVWKKEDQAVKNGNFYEMQVSHFSFWNCDVPANAIYLSLNLKDQNANILSNTFVDLTSQNYGARGGFTDSLGNVSGLVPQNELLILTVLGNYYICGYNPLYTQNIGPFASDASLNITATLSSQQMLSINGNATDCSGGTLQTGTAIIYTPYQTYYTSVTNGAFNIDITDCTSAISSIDIVVVDNSTQQQSSLVTIAVSGNTVNVGTISACGVNTSEFINYNINGTNYSMNVFSQYVYGSNAEDIYGSNNTDYVYIMYNQQTPGTGVEPLTGFKATQIPDSIIVPANTTINITEYGAVGQFISGNFSDTWTGQFLGNTYIVTCSFRVRRNY
jgi:hypothetical protein